MFEVPAAILKQAAKCGHDYSCLRSAWCGDRPMCDVEAQHGSNVLCVISTDWPDCHYHLDFGGARFCVCPVRCAIYRQQAV
jgi:hypothetical protein